MPHPPAEYALEFAAIARGHHVIAGVDEAGRGPIAGPVVAAAVVLDPQRIPDGVADSKTLTQRRREELFDALLSVAHTGVGIASVAEIERINIREAAHLAMCRAVAGLAVAPDHVLVDGDALPRAADWSGAAIVRGDALCLSIAAASIVAKTVRDRLMVDLAQQHPGYGWERNAGYPTKAHIAALQDLGPTPHHRRTFAPVHKILYQAKSVTP